MTLFMRKVFLKKNLKTNDRVWQMHFDEDNILK